jgi:hypothetical protein
MDGEYTLHGGPNDGISRGDRDDTGDLAARPTRGSRRSEDLEDLTIVSAEDASLGLTNVGEKGPDDWAADTGPTSTNEAYGGVVTTDLGGRGSTLSEHGANQPDYEDRLGDMPLGTQEEVGGDRTRNRTKKPRQRG